MLTNNQFKKYTSLKQVKYRYLIGLFSVEGLKNVEELLQSDYVTEALITTGNWLDSNSFSLNTRIETDIVSEKDMLHLSSLATPPGIIAIAEIPENLSAPINLKGTYTLVLDGINDPGNLGTIIRTADWFGFQQIVCSTDTVDVFNQKVVQASMGSIFRVKVVNRELSEVFTEAQQQQIPIYGTTLDGENVYASDINPLEALLVIGSESHGIREDSLRFLSRKIAIPNYGSSNRKAESLNASVATAVFLAEIRRRQK